MVEWTTINKISSGIWKFEFGGLLVRDRGIIGAGPGNYWRGAGELCGRGPGNYLYRAGVKSQRKPVDLHGVGKVLSVDICL